MRCLAVQKTRAASQWPQLEVAAMFAACRACSAVPSHINKLDQRLSAALLLLATCRAPASIQQPYYHLPKTFFSSAYVRAAEAAAGTTLKASREH
jgi:hypothetical protein